MDTMTHLSTAECWDLLEHETLGRLALIGDHDMPDVFPVNYLAHEGAIYIRTAHDSKLVRIVTHPVAAFEIDGAEGALLWSVVVRGGIQRLKDEAEIERVGVGRLPSWSPRHKPYVLKLTGQIVTGRRFAKAEHSAPRHPARPAPAASEHVAQPDDELLKPPSVPPLHQA